MSSFNNLSTTTSSTTIQQISNATNSTIPSCFFPTGLKFYMCLLNVLICISSVLANVLFCLAVYKKETLHKLPMAFIVNLSITNIIISLLVPFFMFTYTVSFPNWPLGLIGNHLFNTVWAFSIVATFSNVTVIAFERYFAIYKPKFHERNRTRLRIGLVVFFIWFYCLAWSVGVYFSLKPILNVERYEWNVHHAVYYSLVGVNMGLPMFIIPVLYCLSRRRIGLMRRNSENYETKPLIKEEGQNEEEDKKSVESFKRSLLEVIMALFLVWIPILIMDCVYTELNNKCKVKIADLMNTFLPLNCFLNPILYSYGTREVAEYLKDLRNRFFNCCCRRRRLNISPESDPEA